MINEQPQVPSIKNQPHWPSILVLLNAGGGLLVFIAIAGTTFLNGFINLISQKATFNEIAIMFSYTAAGLLLTALLLPSITLAVRRISGAKINGNLWHNIFALLHPKKLIWLFPLLILTGYWITDLQPLNWLLMPILNVLALSIPVAWLLWIGSKRLNPGSLQRNWSTFGIGMTTSPLLILAIEILFMALAFLALAVLFSTVFSGADLNLDNLFSSLTQGTEPPPLAELEIARFIRQPVIMALLLLFVSGFVPLVEEIIKPIAVWLMWRKPLSPQDGWILGLLSGAGFALIENLGNLTVGDGWVFLVLARSGAAALHIFNTAIFSYTVVLARVKKRFLPAVLGLLATILIHGLWNGITVFATLTSLENSASSNEIWPIGYIIILAAISLCMVGGILMINQHLFSKQSLAMAKDTASQPNPLEPELPEKLESEY